MEANLSTLPPERSRRKFSREMLALCAWNAPEQGRTCDLSEVLRETPASARIGLALWLQDAAMRWEDCEDPEMNPERFPQRRNTRLMIPHTAGNSDRVLFSLRLPEPAGSPDHMAQNANEVAYQVALHGERRARRKSHAERLASEDDAMTEFAGSPAPAWIMAYQDGRESK